MDTKRDIASRQDITLFINEFYEIVRADQTIGFIFNDVIEMDWEHHIPLIVDFWETILLDNPVYKNNAMSSHFHVNSKVPLTIEHFDAWLNAFSSSIDNNFEGPVCEMAKKRAKSIAAIMHLKMEEATKRQNG